MWRRDLNRIPKRDSGYNSLFDMNSTTFVFSDMTTLLTPYIPFAPITWWAAACGADHICFDGADPFRKMTFRNRYYIAGANGIIRLSIPILHGREQRIAMKDIRISNTDRWQIQHWRTIISAYRRAPFFGFYEPELYPLFHRPFTWLIDFNLAAFTWLQERLPLPVKTHTDPCTNDDTVNTDLRHYPQQAASDTTDFPVYSQVFADRTGFIPDLSLLDLFFAEGPGTRVWLKQHRHLL